MKYIVIFTLLVRLSLFGQSTVAHFSGPSFSIPFSGQRELDVNRDGAVDFVFANDGMLCTADVPVSACAVYYLVAPRSRSAFLARDRDLLISPSGTLFGVELQVRESWETSEFAKTLVSYTINMRNSGEQPRKAGILSDTKEGYIGIRLEAAGTVHYGWVHVRLGDSSELQAPEILEWAVETRPGTPIRAGAKPQWVAVDQLRSNRAGYLRVRWSSEVDVAYQIQEKQTVESPFWSNLPFILIATSTNAAVELPITNSSRFYRVVKAD